MEDQNPAFDAASALSCRPQKVVDPKYSPLLLVDDISMGMSKRAFPGNANTKTLFWPLYRASLSELQPFIGVISRLLYWIQTPMLISDLSIINEFYLFISFV